MRFIESWDANGVVLNGNTPKLIPLVDKVTGDPISAANTVVLFAMYWPLGGNEKYEVEFWAKKKGRALLFRAQVANVLDLVVRDAGNQVFMQRAPQAQESPPSPVEPILEKRRHRARRGPLASCGQVQYRPFSARS